MKIFFRTILLLLPGLMLFACTKNVVVKVPAPEQKLVVEGHIENDSFPVVILTKNSAFYDTLKLSELANYFVHNAVVKVSDGVHTATLRETLVPYQGSFVFGYTTDSLRGQLNTTYTLSVDGAGMQVSATTTIRDLDPLDSIWVKTGVDPKNDSLVELDCRYSDPAAPGDYVRYFTRQNHDAFWPGVYSVFEDKLINGTTFNFSLDRGVNYNDDHSFRHYGLFYKGDTITVKWCHIDYPHYNFWRTLEYERGSTGNPFSSPVQIQSNIVGGLGIWGGYATSYKTVVAPH